jgi:hypothetical protein
MMNVMNTITICEDLKEGINLFRIKVQRRSYIFENELVCALLTQSRQTRQLRCSKWRYAKSLRRELDSKKTKTCESVVQECVVMRRSSRLGELGIISQVLLTVPVGTRHEQSYIRQCLSQHT